MRDENQSVRLAPRLKMGVPRDVANGLPSAVHSPASSSDLICLTMARERHAPSPPVASARVFPTTCRAESHREATHTDSVSDPAYRAAPAFSTKFQLDASRRPARTGHLVAIARPESHEGPRGGRLARATVSRGDSPRRRLYPTENRPAWGSPTAAAIPERESPEGRRSSARAALRRSSDRYDRGEIPNASWNPCSAVRTATPSSSQASRMLTGLRNPSRRNCSSCRAATRAPGPPALRAV